MSIGLDLKNTLIEVGSHLSLSGEIGSGEYVDFEPNAQVTKPFIREFFLEATFPYDTSGETGLVVNLDDVGDFLLMNKIPEKFENETFQYNVVLYRCNVSGELWRPSGETRDNYYHQEMEFEKISPTVFGLQTDPLFGNIIEEDEELGVLGISRNELYLPTYYGIQPHDRYQPASGEYYLVETVLPRRFTGIDVVRLGEDNR